MKLSEGEVVSVLKRLADILKRKGKPGSKIAIKHRDNNDYCKIVKTLDRLGYGYEELLKELGRLEFKHYHNTATDCRGLQLHSFILPIEGENIYVKFEFIISSETNEDKINLISFHEDE